MKQTKQSFQWNKVTPLSKYLAMALFIAMPFFGFLLGIRYQKAITVSPTPITSTTNITNNVGLANPAAVYCQEQGGKNQIITAADGSQSGQCVFSDGQTCDDWQFFRTKVCK